MSTLIEEKVYKGITCEKAGNKKYVTFLAFFGIIDTTLTLVKINKLDSFTSYHATKSLTKDPERSFSFYIYINQF